MISAARNDHFTTFFFPDALTDPQDLNQSGFPFIGSTLR